MTMTQNVRDLFAKRFEENGIDITGLRVGNFTNVGLECPIPLFWLFNDLFNDIDLQFKIESVVFRVVDELGMDDTKYSANFDWIHVTDNEQVFGKEASEDF